LETRSRHVHDDSDTLLEPLVARDTSFYYAFLMLPPAKRNAIVAVWDFCRAVDDAVDEAVPAGEWPLSSEARAHAERELAEWRAEVDRCFAAPGAAMDLGIDRYATFDQLREYCRRVASAVGLICIEIFGSRDRAARDYAINLGLALQLTNIIRDIAVDLARGRIYLPQEDLTRFGCSDDDLRRGVVTDRVRALLAFECERARHYFALAAQSLRHTSPRRLVAAEIMGAVYREILRRIERGGYDVFTRVIRVPRPARAIIAITTWIKTIARPWMLMQPVHD
jgi:15-cis-phytoene synthase